MKKLLRKPKDDVEIAIEEANTKSDEDFASQYFSSQ